MNSCLSGMSSGNYCSRYPFDRRKAALLIRVGRFDIILFKILSLAKVRGTNMLPIKEKCLLFRIFSVDSVSAIESKSF